MKAAILRDGAMVVDDIDELTPGPGQVLAEVVACGICGSDLHTVGHAHEMVDAAKIVGSPVFDFDPDADLVMGHEVSVRVLATGDGVAPGLEDQFFAARPYLMTPAGRVVPGYDNTYPGGYSEQMLLDPIALVPVPNGFDPVLAALTEPMAVGLNAVNETSAGPGRSAVVIGAGPVGLAVIAALRIKGVSPIIASDYSAKRRALAATMGADVVVDPTQQLPMDALRENDDTGRPPVVFEAVGVPGVIDEIIATTPDRSEICVVGVCMAPDAFRPMLATFKNLSLRFVLGWTPEEFTESLHNLAEGRIDPTPLVSAEVDLDGVPAAFAELAQPDAHVKILVRP